MIAPPSDPRAAAWFEAGVRASPMLTGRASAVVVGRDPDATAWVALGLARATAPIRRVAVGDLIGDAAPITALFDEPAAEGIVDSFLYGVSLNRIAREVPGLGNCYLLPSGSEAVQREDIVASDRWKRLAAGFGEVGATLLLVTTADAPGLDALVEHAGGAICVGTDVLLGPGTVTLGTVLADLKKAVAAAGPPEIVTRRPTADFRAVLDDALRQAPDAPAAPAAPREDAASSPSPSPEAPDTPGGRGWPAAGGWQPPPPATTVRPASRWLIPGLLFAAALSGGAALSLWRSRQQSPAPDSAAVAATPPAAAPAAAPSADSGADAGEPAPPATDSLDAALPLEIANPADSLLAAAWSIELVTANTEEAARQRLVPGPRNAPPLPAGTWAPATIGASRTLWYKAFAGAFVTRPAAESLLVQWRQRKLLAADQGRVVRVPFAFRLAADVPSDSLAAYLSGFSGLGLPAYALRRPDGTAEVLAGAFDSPQQAALHVPALRAARVEPVLVFRTGRAF